jgi:hypothetical protein
VTVTAAVSPVRRSQTARGRIEVVCNGSVVRTKTVVSGRTSTLDLPGLGPATCDAALVSTSTARQRYSVRLRLAVETVSQR